MAEIIMIILGMAVVTYLPRLFPFLLLARIEIPPRVDGFLKCIPAAAIGALIIPGVFTATPEIPLAAVAGISFALLFGLLRGGIIIPVLGSVAVAWVVLLIS